MNKLALPVALLFLALAGAERVCADELRLLKPTSDKLLAGRTVTISWDYTLMEWQPQTAAERKLRIDLLKGQAFESKIVEVDLNSNKYSWKVPTLDQSLRKIKIYMVQKPSLSACSASFKITPPIQGILTQSPVASNSPIAVYTPVAGNSYNIATNMFISWDTTKIADHGKVWLQVCWADHSGAGAPYLTANNGYYYWYINETGENDLCIKIWTTDSKHTGFSGVFHVKK